MARRLLDDYSIHRCHFVLDLAEKRVSAGHGRAGVAVGAGLDFRVRCRHAVCRESSSLNRRGQDALGSRQDARLYKKSGKPNY